MKQSKRMDNIQDNKHLILTTNQRLPSCGGDLGVRMRRLEEYKDSSKGDMRTDEETEGHAYHVYTMVYMLTE